MQGFCENEQYLHMNFAINVSVGVKFIFSTNNFRITVSGFANFYLLSVNVLLGILIRERLCV
jgi:hypothetical protein